LTTEELRAGGLRAAVALEESGALGEAFAQYLAANEVDRAVALLVREAPKLIAQGRGATLRALAQPLGQDAPEQYPRLGYWCAASLVAQNPATARAQLESLNAKFASLGDILGQTLCVAGILESHQLEYVNFGSYEKWLPLLENLVGKAPIESDEATMLRVYSSLLSATSRHRPHARTQAHCVQAMIRLLAGELPASEKVPAGYVLMTYANHAGEATLAQRVMRLIDPLLAEPGVTPLSRLYWSGAIGLYHLHFPASAQSYDDAANAFDKALDIAATEGLQSFAALFLYTRACCAFIAGDQEGARDRCKALLARLDPSRLLIVAQVKQLEAMLNIADGRLNEARENAQRAMQAARDARFFYLHATWQILCAFVLAESGSYEELRECLTHARNLTAGTFMDDYEADYLLIEAYAAFKGSDTSIARQRLEAGLTRLNRAHVWGCRWLPGLLARLCQEALDADICVEWVREMIRRFDIRPHTAESEKWPWPVRITTLGGFSIHLEGEPLQQSGKQQKRPITLLKMLIAHGGREINISDLTEALWPDLDGDNARSAFNMAAHRLRKLLNNEAALTIQGGAVSLNGQLCWIDVWAFERLCARTAEAMKETATTSILADLGERCLRLYQGDFLANDEESRWLSAQRERVRGRLRQQIDMIGAALEGVARWDAAAQLYQRGVDADPVAEAHYLRLMNALSKQGKLSEAISVWRRCRQMLSVVLSTEPSAEGKRLYETIRSLQG
jgi:LuxR family transcriptional regulator, maltose regulon positive regulatory protein